MLLSWSTVVLASRQDLELHVCALMSTYAVCTDSISTNVAMMSSTLTPMCHARRQRGLSMSSHCVYGIEDELMRISFFADPKGQWPLSNCADGLLKYPAKAEKIRMPKYPRCKHMVTTNAYVVARPYVLSIISTL